MSAGDHFAVQPSGGLRIDFGAGADAVAGDIFDRWNQGKFSSLALFGVQGRRIARLATRPTARHSRF